MRNSIKKKNMNFQSVEALQQVVNVVNEDATALDDPKRTIRVSAIPESWLALWVQTLVARSHLLSSMILE